MDYRYIYPLYEKSDTDEARYFLADKMAKDVKTKKDSGIGIIREGEFGPEQVPLSDAPQEYIRAIFENIVATAYGVNIALMANYTKVEDIFFEKYQPSILRYFYFCGVKAKFTTIYKGSISAKLLAYRSQNDKNFVPLSLWNPTQEWKSMKYTDNCNINIMNPINTCAETVLEIDGDIPYKFIEELSARDIEGYFTESNPGVYNHINIKVLPSKTYKPIINLTRLIHKYF